MSTDHDISNRYIDASILASARGVRAPGADRSGDGRERAPLEGGRVAHSTLTAVPSVTDYALARRAVLRDFRSGALTRLDVCDAHPELMRAAQNIGADIDDECPVCGASNLRLVTYVYGDKLKQANGRAISNTGRAARSWARRATSSPVTTSRSASTAGGTTCAASRCTAASTRAEPSRSSSRSASTGSLGYCEQHEMHHSSGSGTTVSEPSRVPRRRARRRRAGRSTSSSSGKPQFSQAPVASRRRSLRRLAWTAPGRRRYYARGAAGSRTCPGRRRCGDDR